MAHKQSLNYVAGDAMGDEALLGKLSDKFLNVPDDALSPCQRIFKLIWELEAEVNNGGFNQYFFNSSGRDAAHAPEALSAIGADKCSQLVRQALTIVNFGDIDLTNDLSRRDFIIDLGENINDELDMLDEKFYLYPDNLSDLLTEFVISHPKDFGI